jgi:hypothetical protein
VFERKRKKNISAPKGNFLLLYLSLEGSVATRQKNVAVHSSATEKFDIIVHE